MPMTLCNEGEKFLLERAVGKVAATGQKLRLFTNNYTPTHADVVGSYTEFGTGSHGYAPIALATNSWNNATAGTGTGTAAGNKASITYAQQSFVSNGTGGTTTVYGYFVTDDGGTVCLGGERFSTPKVFAQAGDAIRVTPAYTFTTDQ